MVESVQAKPSAPRFYGWINAILLSFIYLTTSGLVFYSFSVIFPVMLRETGWSRGDASIAVSLGTLAGGFFIPLGAKLLNKYGSRHVIMLGLAILFLSLLLLSTAITKLWHWTVIYGLLFPIGSVLCGPMSTQVNIMYWFNRHRAMAIGLLMTGAPIGGMLAPPVYTWFMTQMGGWRSGWILSTSVVFLTLIPAFWVKSKPSDIGQYPDGIAPGTLSRDGLTLQPTEARTYRTKVVWTLREVLRTRTIWLLTVANLAQGITLGIVVNHGVLHLTDIGYSSMNAAYILSSIIMFSGFVRFPVGWLGDRVEPRWIYLIALTLMLIGFTGIWKAPSFTTLMLLGPCYGMAYGSILTIGPTIFGNYYGPEVFPSIRGFFGPWVTLISAGIPTIAGYSMEKLGSYNEVFLVLSIFLTIGIVCSAFLSPPEKPVAKNAVS